MNIKYKAIFVPEELHKEIKVLATGREQTMIDFLDELLTRSFIRIKPKKIKSSLANLKLKK